MVDLVLKRAWALHTGPGDREVALVAVGGYGRGELHPCSDIDVMILLPKSGIGGGHDGIERFLAFLWDIGLEVGHSVRTIDDCQRESAADVSVATTLIEARLLAGPDNLFQAMRRALARTSVEPRRSSRRSPSRRRGITATTTGVQPRGERGPGAARHQTIGWAKRHFGADAR
jgi:[protein-PII] uridylyltransferase